jgi:hypothetical protein
MIQESKGWSPYVAGALSGLLSIASVLVAGKYLGASTTFVRAVGMIERTVSAQLVDTPYFLKYTLGVDWQFMFVTGIILGAFISSRQDGSFRVQLVPDMWQRNFGPGGVYRSIIAFVGGMVAVYGARFAGGCPSGHGLSGLTQLSVSGFVAAACFFAGGIVSANIMYGRGRR